MAKLKKRIDAVKNNIDLAQIEINQLNMIDDHNERVDDFSYKWSEKGTDFLEAINKVNMLKTAQD